MKKAAFAGILCLLLGAASGWAQTITVNQPNSSAPCYIGSTYTITWTYSGVLNPNVKIRLRQGDVIIQSMTNSWPISNKSYSWTVPAGVSPGTYYIRVRTIDDAVTGDSQPITIAVGPRKVEPMKDRPSAVLKFPALSISDVKIIPYDDSFFIAFAYKNTGGAALPKSSDMPEKPNFRVLIDSREVASGRLIFPAFPAPPGWEVPTFSAHEIKFSTAREFEENWTIGNMVTVKINENKINGMAADSQTYNLKQIALNYYHDDILTGATYDWKTEVITVSARVDGNFGHCRKIRIFNTGRPGIFVDSAMGGFLKDFDAVPGQNVYTFKIKMPLSYRNEYTAYLGVYLVRPDGMADWKKDIEHRNNLATYTFRR